MKNTKRPRIVATSIILLCAIWLTGCATDVDTKPLLSAAGFRAHTPETPAERKAFEELPSYKVERERDNDKTFYVYKDSKEGIVYVGSEAQYQRYQLLAVEKDISEDYQEAAELNRRAALGSHDDFPRLYLY